MGAVVVNRCHQQCDHNDRYAREQCLHQAAISIRGGPATNRPRRKACTQAKPCAVLRTAFLKGLRKYYQLTSLSFSDNSRHLHESWSTSRRTSLPKASLRSCRPIACGATALCIIGTTLSDMLKFRTPCVHRRRHGHPNWVGGVGALEGIPTLPSDSWDARGNALVTVFTSLGTKTNEIRKRSVQRSSQNPMW